MLWLVCYLIVIQGSQVNQLGHREYNVRQRSYEHLEAQGLLAAPAAYFGSRSADPETARRCRRLLEGQRDHCYRTAAALCVRLPGEWHPLDLSQDCMLRLPEELYDYVYFHGVTAGLVAPGELFFVKTPEFWGKDDAERRQFWLGCLLYMRHRYRGDWNWPEKHQAQRLPASNP